MSQCKTGVELPDGTVVFCQQNVEDHRAAHGPFEFMTHDGPDGRQHHGWPDQCWQKVCKKLACRVVPK